MPAYFFDSSSIVKRYTHEEGTQWVIKIFRSSKANRIYIARITFVEVLSALSRKVRDGKLSQSAVVKAITRFRRDYEAKFRHVEISAALIEHAAQLSQLRNLRAYDAVQLAAALEINSRRILEQLTPITFVCADHRLLDAAVVEGMLVENPKSHS